MGRELQKKKNRSSIAKVRRKPKSKKKILSNHIIAANWDKSQTLAQNYRRLGLTVKLNKNTGGVERKAGDERTDDALRIDGKHGTGAEAVEVREARIERDPETGAILRVLDDGSGKGKKNPLNDPLAHLDSDESSEGEEFDQHGQIRARDVVPAKTQTVVELERQARRPAAKYVRKQSEGERAFVEELVRKYGDDYGRMARDGKINYMQRSEGDLKKRVKKWRELGGTVD